MPVHTLLLLKELIHAGCLHILVTGDPGVGKTTVLGGVIRAIHGSDPPLDSILDMSALRASSSSHRKEALQTFCRAPMSQPKRIVLFDDADLLSAPIQETIRSCIDNYGTKVNFLGACTRIDSLSNSLLHRLLHVPLPVPSRDCLAGLLDRICSQESMDLEADARLFVLDSASGVRDMVQQLEKLSLRGGPITRDIACACFSRVHPSRLNRLTTLARQPDGGYGLAQEMYALYDEGHSVMDLLDAYIDHLKCSPSTNNMKRLLPVLSRAVRMYHSVQENEITLAIAAKEMSESLALGGDDQEILA